VRIEKFLNVLAESCDEVHLVARNRQKRPAEEQAGKVRYHRLYPLAFNGFAGALCDSPLFFNPRWFRRIGEVVRSVRPQVVIVRDLPLALACRFWAEQVGAAFIFDMAEDYPSMFRAYRPWETLGQRALNLVLRNGFLARLVELLSLRKLDRLIVVTEEQRDRLERLGVPRERIVIVGNTPVFRPCATRPSGSPVTQVVYVGEVHLLRGLDCAIRAVALLARQQKAVRLRILGEGKSENALRLLAAHIAPEQVAFEGWVAPQRVPEEVAKSDIGIVPHQKNAFTNTTVPNKLFDYMAAGIPVVVSDTLPMKRIVEETDCGLVFAAGDDAALADTLLRLTDPRLRHRLGSNGRQAVEQRYNWSTDSHILKQLVAECACERNLC